MEEKRKSETIVLLNDGNADGKEGHCNSWPSPLVYDDYVIWWPQPCVYK